MDEGKNCTVFSSDSSEEDCDTTREPDNDHNASESELGDSQYSAYAGTPKSSADLFSDIDDQMDDSPKLKSEAGKGSVFGSENQISPTRSSRSSGSGPEQKKSRNDKDEQCVTACSSNQREPGKKAGTPLSKLPRVTLENCQCFYRPADRVGHDMSKDAGSKCDNMWDHLHVRMPYTSPPNKMYSMNSNSRWNDTILPALQCCESVSHISELQNMILSYNKSQDWSFAALEQFLYRSSKYEMQDIWKTIWRMGNLASRLQDICPKSIPLLRKEKTDSITLSKLQIACLLCNAFFCTFPMRNSEPVADRKHGIKKLGEGSGASEVPILPSFNFSRLFQRHPGREKSIHGKLHCLFNYFNRITKEEPQGCVTFERLVRRDNEFPVWSESRKHFTRLHVRREGFIEDEGEGMLQVDFANKRVGGGVLGRGCVQEEIRFLICPELIVSRLFTEELGHNEALLITGCERYNNFTGYGDSFAFAGDHKDKTPRDSFGRCLTQVVAMDAKCYTSQAQQFEEVWIKRELKKAYCGFSSTVRGSAEHTLPAVATGNWGCGAFRGDRHLKSLIQLMAASEAGRDVLYITIDDNQLVDDLYNVHQLFVNKNLTVGDVYEIIMQYCKKYRRMDDMPTLIEYILSTYSRQPANHEHGQPAAKSYSDTNITLAAAVADDFAGAAAYGNATTCGNSVFAADTTKSSAAATNADCKATASSERSNATESARTAAATTSTTKATATRQTYITEYDKKR